MLADQLASCFPGCRPCVHMCTVAGCSSVSCWPSSHVAPYVDLSAQDPFERWAELPSRYGAKCLGM